MDRTAHAAPRVNPLTGRFFVSNDGAICGQIIAEISNGHFLSQLYGPTGAPGEKQVFHVARMRDWKFFDRREDWLRAAGAA